MRKRNWLCWTPHNSVDKEKSNVHWYLRHVTKNRKVVNKKEKLFDEMTWRFSNKWIMKNQTCDCQSMNKNGKPAPAIVPESLFDAFVSSDLRKKFDVDIRIKRTILIVLLEQNHRLYHQWFTLFLGWRDIAKRTGQMYFSEIQRERERERSFFLLTSHRVEE